MKFEDFENMRKNAIRWELYQERLLRNIEFSALIDRFNAYENEIGDSTKRFVSGESDDDFVWLDPRDKQVKRVEKVDKRTLSNIMANIG